MEVVKETEKPQADPKAKKKIGVATQKMFMFKPKFLWFGMPSKEDIDHEINSWLKWQTMNGQPAVLGKYLYSNNKFIAIYLYTEFVEM